jgi:hypothetical protein
MEHEHSAQNVPWYKSLVCLNSFLLLVATMLVLGTLFAVFILIYLSITNRQYTKLQQSFFEQQVIQVSTAAVMSALRTDELLARYRDSLQAVATRRLGTVPGTYSPSNFKLYLLQLHSAASLNPTSYTAYYWGAALTSLDNINQFGMTYPLVRGLYLANQNSFADILYFEYFDTSLQFMVYYPGITLAKLTPGYNPAS